MHLFIINLKIITKTGINKKRNMNFTHGRAEKKHR